MLFNSLVFIFGFLPVVLAGYYLLAALRLERLRLLFIILTSLVFYGYWTPEYTVLFGISVTLNHLTGRAIATARDGGRMSLAGWLVVLGVVLNLAALGYYKYANFFVDTLNAALGTEMILARIVLPLAISFYTFQQIAYLVDIGRGIVRPGGFLSFTAFVIFFPHLIAGPITQYQDLAPQLAARPRLDRALQNILIGLVIFGIGLAKKTIFADTAALYASPVFDAAAAGSVPGMLAAWGAALAYTLQIYFDFSGYSDMAIGLARMFGVLLPLNFHSPLRAGSISGLWRQWHMTLGQFVRVYILQPIATPLARWSARRGHDRVTGHRYAVLLPTFVAMLVIGIWHGAGWNFVIFGALHGAYMVINEAWTFRRRQRKRPPLPVWLTAPVDRGGGHVLTLLAFVVASVPFRAVDEATTARMWTGMLGGGGAALPEAWPLGVAGLLTILAAGYLMVYLMPNTQQMMRNIYPALDWDQWDGVTEAPVRLVWAPTWPWMLAAGAVLCLGIVFILRGSSEFIYFNF